MTTTPFFSLQLSDNLTTEDRRLTALTDPSVLLASGSATIQTPGVKKETPGVTVTDASVSGMLASYDLSVSNIFKSLGKAILGATTIAGDLSIDGMFSISNNSINVIGTPTVIPAKAGIQLKPHGRKWIPAYTPRVLLTS